MFQEAYVSESSREAEGHPPGVPGIEFVSASEPRPDTLARRSEARAILVRWLVRMYVDRDEAIKRQAA